MENQWLKWAKRLQAIASTGLHFSRDDFDRERFDEVASIAQSMLAALGNLPLERIRGLVSDAAQGYATPKVDVRGALVEDGRILLVREKSDGLWTLPGGFADIGLSAGENVQKEMQEEAGIRVSVDRLYSVRHKCGMPTNLISAISTNASFCAGEWTGARRCRGLKPGRRIFLRATACRHYRRGGSLRTILKPLSNFTMAPG